MAVLNFETGRQPNHPMIRVKIGSVDLLGSFDTGQYGLLQLNDQAAKVLKKSSLVLAAGNDGQYKTVWDYDEKKIYVLEK